MNTSRYRPTREAVFTESMQTGIVVRALAAAPRRYVDDSGIGPWQIHEFNAVNAQDLHKDGRPVEGAATRVAGVPPKTIHPPRSSSCPTGGALIG